MDNYEQKYNEALRLAKSYYGEGCNEFLDTLFPELRESEDERIRKQCIKLLREAYSTKYEAFECIAWLEKQKEQTTDAKSERVIKAARRVLNNWLYGDVSADVSGDLTELEYAIREYDGEEKQKEQKPAEKTAFTPIDTELTEFEKAVVKLCQIGKDEYPCYEFAKKYASSLLDIAKKEFEKPAEWSEEDMRMIDNIASILGKYIDYKSVSGTGSGYATPRYANEISWLKSLRPQPQGTYKQIVHSIYDMLKDKDFFEIQPSHRVSLLNDIRVKCKIADECAEILDEPHWKPSEEQMEAFRSYLEDFQAKAEAAVGGWNNFDVMIHLYEQLKKMM